MKLIRMYKEKFLFQISKREKQLLFDLLALYPLVPATYSKLTKKAKADVTDADQRLLEESLASQRKENQKHVLAMLNEPDRFKSSDPGYRFSLARTEIEWLLQVFNDVRVGSWIALGSPDYETEQQIEVTAKTAPHWWTMEIARAFQMFLLGALNRPSSSK